MALPQKQTLEQLSTKWAAAINPVLNNPIVKGVQLTGINLVAGDNAISHKLQIKPNGYIITSMYNSFAQIYTIPSNMPTLTLILNASAPTTVDIYVY